MGYADGYPVRLFGGRLALDFVNTADWSQDQKVVHEKLLGREDLLVWMEATGLGEAFAPDSIEEILSLRAALRASLIAAIDGDDRASVPQVDVGAVNAADGSLNGWRVESLVLVSALAILQDRRERRRLKACAGPYCGWLFIDESRGSRRQWCSMVTCGNRAKAQRHYARHKKTTDGNGSH